MNRSNRPRYRYITSGTVNSTAPLRYYALCANNKLGNQNTAIRFIVPDDMILEKLSCDDYSTTEDKRTLNDIGYDVLIKFKKKWVVRNDLKPFQPHEFHEVLFKNERYCPVPNQGFLTKDDYVQYLDERRKFYAKQDAN